MEPRLKSRKPLIFWCRWHDAVLRSHGSDGVEVHGEFFYADEDRSEPFTFNMVTWQLTRANKTVQLDHMGVELD